MLCSTVLEIFHEIEGAVRTLYLTTWLGRRGENIKNQVDAMTEARVRTVVEYGAEPDSPPRGVS